jgi:hypothetical protein
LKKQIIIIIGLLFCIGCNTKETELSVESSYYNKIYTTTAVVKEQPVEVDTENQ